MNPSFQTWSSRAIVFSDAMQRVREFSYWRDGTQGRAPSIPSGPGAVGAGWPDPAYLANGERYGALLFGSMEGTLPDGRTSPYVVTWEGSGSCRLEGVFVTGERNRTSNRVEVLVDPTVGSGNASLACSWTATDPGDPVRNVHVWLPEMEPSPANGNGRIFWPPFLTKLRSMNAGRGPHTWRTLDWTRVNEFGRSPEHGGFVFDRDALITPRSPSQGTLRGVAAAYQVALCNELGMNLHFQLPHRTDDLSEEDYLRFVSYQLRVIRDGTPGSPGVLGGRRFDGLAPGLTVTVELSNEIWNTFPVNDWMKREAERKEISFPEQVASQIQLVFDTADSVFDGADRVRLRKYVAGFVGDPGYLERILAFLRPGTQVDAVGAAAYLGPRRPDMDAWLAGATPGSCPNCPDAAELLATAGRSVESLRPLLRLHRAVAGRYRNPDGSHPALVLYEGGLNLKAGSRPWSDAARQVQRMPELFDLLAERYVPMLVEEGVSLLNWYSFMTDQDSPTLDAYGVWNDMAQELTLPITRPYRDEGAPKAAVVCLGPPLADSCPDASATFRPVFGTFATYSAAAPVLGGVFSASVDLRATGNAAAFVIATLQPGSIPIPSGQTILAGPTGVEFLPLTFGPIARWQIRVPNDPSLAGLQITTQAYHVGGGVAASVSNAMDLRFGR